jgi:(p)ppGpp synthase/HD superfamily hydrolase
VSKLVENAISIAKLAHENQFDKSGVDYINHPMYVASKLSDDELKAVAILHDVLEDSDYTAKYLITHFIPKDIVDAVVCMTKVKGEKYDVKISKNRRSKT